MQGVVDQMRKNKFQYQKQHSRVKSTESNPTHRVAKGMVEENHMVL